MPSRLAKAEPVSKIRLCRVIPGSMADLVAGRVGHASHAHMDAPKLGIGRPFRWIVSKQVLGAEFVADLAEGFVELHCGSGVVILAAGVFGELDEGVLAPDLASGAGLNRHHDD